MMLFVHMAQNHLPIFHSFIAIQSKFNRVMQVILSSKLKGTLNALRFLINRNIM